MGRENKKKRGYFNRSSGSPSRHPAGPGDRPPARWPLWSLLLPAALLAVAGFYALGLRGRPRPGFNVLLISVDTLRVDHLGLSGYDRPTSPNMDQLARAGLVFTQAICQNTNTNPSHASILSGMYPRSHGNWDNYFMMDEAIPLAPGIFQDAGYSTAAFVSGYTLKKKICRLDRGFQTYDDAFDGKERHGDQTTDRAIEWLRTHGKQPFFLFVHLFDPHGPYTPPPEVAMAFPPRQPAQLVPLDRIPRYQRLPREAAPADLWTNLERYKAAYDAEIAFADRQVGRLLETLESLGLASSTVVVLTSDHGEALDERFHLLDHGGGIGDEEIRVPLIFRFPDGRFAGQRFTDQVESVDILPTLTATVGLASPSTVQGINLLPMLEGAHAAPHPETLTETRVIPVRWRDRDYKLNIRDTLKAVRRAGAKLVVFPGLPHDYTELYDLATDPLERHDISTDRPGLTRALEDRLKRFMTLPTRRNGVANPDTDQETREIFRTLGYVD